MSKRKKKIKRTPKQMEQLRKKQREMMTRTTEKSKKRVERIKVAKEMKRIKDEIINQKKVQLKKDQNKSYSKITLKDFEDWNFWWIENQSPHLLDNTYKPSNKMKMFFDEFNKRADMKSYTHKGMIHSFFHENGIVLLSNKSQPEEENPIYNKGINRTWFNSENTIVLDWIIADVDKRNKGWGTETMKVLVELTKKYDYTLRLTVMSGKDSHFDAFEDNRFSKYVKSSPLNTDELVRWYKSFGLDTDPTNGYVVAFGLEKRYDTIKTLLTIPSGSVEESMKFPSIKGYETTKGFSYSSTTNYMNKIVYGN
mgnify:CR=1 FL=1|jgi:hypothetical protein|tara:strand:+ start:83 stop:1012 length:930 start_codon:yes stop_codon:yes gene_type:complete